jgi:glycosyltransferase involved in cell wall biosynthesis/2-polyprenyl-3-methyl-5-hydroxy-6-metoxy-1,4-benzoquinol methylase
MHWPKISIVTPSYNQGKFIERTVRSVLLQRYPDLEYIVMDGGSTDDTLDRLASYMELFSYFVSEPDKGQADAIANGFARSSGEIMAYLNSDDLLAPDALHFVARFFRDNPNIDWIYSHRCAVDDEDRVVWYWIVPPHLNFLMRRWDYIPQETCFWRRSLFEKTGNIDRSYRFAMDYDLFVRFMNRGHGRRVNRFLGAFRDHSTSKTKQLLETVGAQEMQRVRRKFMVRAAVTDGIFGVLLGNWIQYVGRYFAAAAHILPGALPGVGYDYNEVWGGLLRSGELPMEPVEPQPPALKDGFYTPLCPVTDGLADRLLFRMTSSRMAHDVINDIYLNSKSRVAIIAPPVETKDHSQVTDRSLGDQLVARRGAHAEIPDRARAASRVAYTILDAVYRLPVRAPRTYRSWEDRTTDQILGLTRGFVAKNDEIAFLDTGCSKGELLDALKARTKWNLLGLEASRSAAAEAISKGHHIFNATLRQAPSIPEIVKGFDLIYLAEGIQCIGEPRASLRTVAFLLNLGGYLILSTPNLDSEQRKLFGSAWAHWKPGRHRFIYSRRSLIKLLEQAGFSLTKLLTASHLESTALSLKLLGEHSPADARCANHPKMLETMKAEGLTRVSNLFWDKLGKGDEIFAIFRRVS